MRYERKIEFTYYRGDSVVKILENISQEEALEKGKELAVKTGCNITCFMRVQEPVWEFIPMVHTESATMIPIRPSDKPKRGRKKKVI